jgi:hypothetical protein
MFFSSQHAPSMSEQSSHLILDSTFDNMAENEMNLTAKLISQVPDNSLPVFDKGFYSLGLLYNW